MWILISLAWLFALAVLVRPDQSVSYLFSARSTVTAQDMVDSSNVVISSELAEARASAMNDANRRLRFASWTNINGFLSLGFFPICGFAGIGFGLLWAIRGFAPIVIDNKQNL